MKPHKWAKEIHAWADGAEIQVSAIENTIDGWLDCTNDSYLCWNYEKLKFRIKPQPGVCVASVTCAELVEQPQPKEPQYLYVYANTNGEPTIFATRKPYQPYLGKIKLETDE